MFTNKKKEKQKKKEKKARRRNIYKANKKKNCLFGLPRISLSIDKTKESHPIREKNAFQINEKVWSLGRICSRKETEMHKKIARDMGYNAIFNGSGMQGEGKRKETKKVKKENKTIKLMKNKFVEAAKKRALNLKAPRWTKEKGRCFKGKYLWRSAGLLDQVCHTDYVTKKNAPDERYSVLFAIDELELILPKWEKKRLLVPKGYAICFKHDCVHAGSGYKKAAFAFFSYVFGLDKKNKLQKTPNEIMLV